MKKSRPVFDASFKLDLAKMLMQQGLSVMHVSQSMHLGPTAIRRWVAQYEAELGGQPRIAKPLTAEQQRIRQLEQENRKLADGNTPVSHLAFKKHSVSPHYANSAA